MSTTAHTTAHTASARGLALLHEAIEDAIYRGEGVDELLALRPQNLSNRQLYNLASEHLVDTRPFSTWNCRPGREAATAAAMLVVREAWEYCGHFDYEEILPPAVSSLDKYKLCLQLAIESYWRAEVIERWGPFEGFRMHPFIDALGKARVAFYPGKATEVAFDLSSDIHREQVEEKIEAWRSKARTDLRGVE